LEIGRRLHLFFLASILEGKERAMFICHHIRGSKEGKMWDVTFQWILFSVVEVLIGVGIISMWICAKLFTRVRRVDARKE
jgi:hypothetical protein